MYWGGVLTSCSNGSEDTEPDGIEKTISEVDEVTFNVTTASVGEANTNIVFTYARSKDGAKEKITIKDCDIEVLLNGEKQKTIKRLDFALNEYGDFMGDKATQYQCKISIEKKVAPGDIVKVVFNKKTGNLIGEGTESALINKLTVSLIDNDKEAGDDGYYNELVESEKEYRPLFPKANDDDTLDDEDGDGNGGSQGSGNGTGNGGQGGGEQGNGGVEGGGAGQGNGGNGDGGQGGSGSGEQDNGNTPVKGDEKITFSVTEDSTNAENTTLIFKYDRGAAGAKELVAIENCGIVVEVNDTVVKTIAKLEFSLDEYGASFDDSKKDKDGKITDVTYAKEYKAKVSIGKQVKKGDAVVVYYNEGVGTITGEGKDTEAIKSLIVSLIDTDEAVDYYKELADNKDEYQPLFPDANEGGNQEPDPVTPAEPKKEDILFDFTKTETVKNDEGKDEVKLDKVYYCSKDPSAFSAENGLTLEVNASWDSAFKIATESLDLSNKNCVIEYKIDNGWTYTSNDGKKCLVQLVSKENSEYKATELSQGEFANDPAETDSWKTAIIDNIYANDWEAEKGADLAKITAIKINTTDGKGTIHIKSIKFVDKE